MAKGDRLIERDQALPRELFDEINDLTFSFWSNSNQVNITEQYRPPSILQVNRNIRNTLAATYYTSYFTTRDRKLLVKWFTSLPKDHAALLKRVVLQLSIDTTDITERPAVPGVAVSEAVAARSYVREGCLLSDARYGNVALQDTVEWLIVTVEGTGTLKVSQDGRGNKFWRWIPEWPQRNR